MLASRFRNLAPGVGRLVAGPRGHEQCADRHDEAGRGARRFTLPMDSEPEAKAQDTAVILVPLDFSPASTLAAQLGASVARHTHARLILCHAVYPKVTFLDPASPGWVMEAMRAEAFLKVQPYLDFARELNVPATVEIEDGTPAGVILKLAQRHAADLIILTARDQGALSRLFFGPTTAEQVRRAAQCHVMIARPEAG